MGPLPVLAWIGLGLTAVIVIGAIAGTGNDGDETSPTVIGPVTGPRSPSSTADATTTVPVTTSATSAATAEPVTTEAAVTTAAPAPTTAQRATTTTQRATTTTRERRPTTTTAPPTTRATLPTFGDGTQLIGADIQPGRYIADGGQSCYWERLSGLGGSVDEIVTNNFGEGRAIVEIAPDDRAFNSTGCGRWVTFLPPRDTLEEFGPGDWAVGTQIRPGVYRSGSTSGDCYWERATGFSHTLDEVITNSFGDAQPTVEILQGDARFTNANCGRWTRIG